MTIDELATATTATTAGLSRRRLLGLLGAAGGAVLLGCAGEDAATASGASTTAGPGGTAATTGSSSATPATTGSTTGSSAPAAAVTGSTATASTAAPSTSAAAVTSCEAIPTETGGPFPADGTNQNGSGELANVLADSRVVRRDIRGDLDGTNVQDGVPMTLRMRVVDTAASCRAVAGAAVYVWHCNREGAYSAYNSNMNGGDRSDRSYLRGVQVTDADGYVTFSTILPGRYQGRAFHIHFEVYGSSDLSQSNKLLTSQVAAEDDKIDALYSTVGYGAAAAAVTHNDEDNVFRDGVELQLLTLSGDGAGVTADIVVGL